jgi:hypothetical protein
MKDSTVSVVLTSCGRLDLLEQTIDSFFSINTYPITQFILIDDSGKDDLLPKLNQLIKKYKAGQITDEQLLDMVSES